MKLRDLTRAALMIVVLALVAAAPAWAQQPPAATDGFVPLSEMANREVLPAAPLVFYAYGFVWVALLAYLYMLWNRVTKLHQDADALRRRIESQNGR
jgi:CcmD family protein